MGGSCSLSNCQESILLGVLSPLLICLVFYCILFGYTIYITDKYHTVDLKNWRQNMLHHISSRYVDLVRQFNREIKKIENA